MTTAGGTEECTLAVHVVDAYGASREIARCGDDALAFCLRTLHDEGQIDEYNVGIRDINGGRWLVSPYAVTAFGRADWKEANADSVA